MKEIRSIIVALIALVAPLAGSAQLTMTTDEGKASYVLTSRDTLEVASSRDVARLTVMSNCDYTVASSTSWLTPVLESDGSITVFASYNYTTLARYGTLMISSEDGTFSRIIVVEQEGAEATDGGIEALSDTQITVTGGSSDNEETSAEDGSFENSYDGDVSTYFHSSWWNGSTSFPYTMTWTFEASHVDYMVYTPRADSQNGAWGNITISYTTSSGTTVTLGSYDLEQAWSSSTITFGDDGVDDVVSVTVVVKDAYGSVVTAAEVAFYAYNEAASVDYSDIFADDLYTTLVDGVTEEDIEAIDNSYFRTLAYQLYEGTYSTDYRVFEVEPYETTSTLQEYLRNSNPYCPVENPIGIYFDSGETVAIIMADIPDTVSVSLVIRYYYCSDNQSSGSSSYSLSNGLNIITASNYGNAYISYYNDDYANLPNVRGHVIMGQQNGYFDSEVDDNETWVQLLSNVISPWLDIVTPRLQVAAMVDALQSGAATDGLALCHIYDQIVYRERQILGLLDNEPKNHQFAQPTSSGSIYASTEGAYLGYNSFSSWAQQDSTSFDVWGLGHELGHNNQITGFKWTGCGETTNNVYAVWVQHNLAGGYHRLEDESGYINVENGYEWTLRGGRFNNYLENAVRNDSSWFHMPGSDYTTESWSTYSGYDEEGNTVEVLYKNFDHFVKCTPLWQLELFCIVCGYAPDAWGDWFSFLRDDDTDVSEMTSGQQQVQFVTKFCEVSGYDLSDFFEKAGLLQETKIYVEDYTPGWLTITSSMVETAQNTIDNLNLKEAPGGLNYINAYNYEIFINKTELTASTSTAECEVHSDSLIMVTNASCPGAVGYNTYDSKGNLLHISMFGLGDSSQSDEYTYVLWEDDASYITAVGYDGSEAVIYRKED